MCHAARHRQSTKIPILLRRAFDARDGTLAAFLSLNGDCHVALLFKAIRVGQTIELANLLPRVIGKILNFTARGSTNANSWLHKVAIEPPTRLKLCDLIP